MQNSLHNAGSERKISRVLNVGAIDHDCTVIDPINLAMMDTVLFKCLKNIGTSKERICSALCLSYAEYDYISEQLKIR